MNLPQDTLDTPAPGAGGVPPAAPAAVDGAAVVAGLHCVLRSFTTCFNAFLSDGEFDFTETWMQAVDSLVMGGVDDMTESAEKRFRRQMECCVWDPEREVEVAEGVAGPTGVVDLYHSSVGMLCRIFEQVRTQAVPVRGIVPAPGQSLPAKVAAQRHKERQVLFERAVEGGAAGDRLAQLSHPEPAGHEFFRSSQGVVIQKKVAAMNRRRMLSLPGAAADPGLAPAAHANQANPMCDPRYITRTAKVRVNPVGPDPAPHPMAAKKRPVGRALPGLVEGLDEPQPQYQYPPQPQLPPGQGGAAQRVNLEPLREADFASASDPSSVLGLTDGSRPPSRVAQVVVDPFGRLIESAQEGKGTLWLRKEPSGPSQDSWVYSGQSDPRELESEKSEKLKLDAISSSVTAAGAPATGVRAKRAQQKAKEHNRQLESKILNMYTPKRLAQPADGAAVPYPVDTREKSHWSSTGEIRVHSRHDAKAAPLAPASPPMHPEVEEILHEMEPPPDIDRGLFSEHVAALKQKARLQRRAQHDPADIDTSPLSIAVDTG
eukprot:TRINITY_DN17131_c0_g1_i1.p1 TRINITY_DN17131_c0_g1~~TRINITY_DN17131_c0_g1_i1.p1  ORF type:complete len:545 (+),score=200.72 TRINITY_DN17131_c0_g1_i1:116-1750(+)